VKDFLVRMLATGFGSGYSPIASGTAGTVAAIPLFVLLSIWGNTGVLAGILVCVMIGIPAATRMEEMLGTSDPGQVVIDEFAGYLVTMIGSPPDLMYITAGFFLFRFFDIVKPVPVRTVERAFPGGLGVMADDLVAGGYAWISLRILEMVIK